MDTKDLENNKIYKQIQAAYRWLNEEEAKGVTRSTMLSRIGLDVFDTIEVLKAYDKAVTGDSITGGQIFLTGVLIGYLQNGQSQTDIQPSSDNPSPN